MRPLIFYVIQIIVVEKGKFKTLRVPIWIEGSGMSKSSEMERSFEFTYMEGL